MCGIVGLCRASAGAGGPARRAGEARVPRIRLRRHLAAVRGPPGVRARRRQPERAARRGRRRRGRRGAAARVAVAAPPATTGIGHTRWATHGRVTEENAHPHFDSDNRVHIVVNGIVENYMELKEELLAQGAEFTSETDVEVMAHLIAGELDRTGDLTEAVRSAYNRLRGHYAFVAVAAEEPGVIVGARKECPLIVGRGDGEQFLGSGIPAFLAHTRQVQYIEDGEIVAVRARRRRVLDRRRHARRARDRGDRLGRRGGREGRPRDVHAQGDPRAGGRGGRDDRRPHRAPRRRRPPRARRRAAAHRASGSWSSPAAPPTTRA